MNYEVRHGRIIVKGVAAPRLLLDPLLSIGQETTMLLHDHCDSPATLIVLIELFASVWFIREMPVTSSRHAATFESAEDLIEVPQISVHLICPCRVHGVSLCIVKAI